MSATATQFRYHLPKRAIKGDCPECSPKHRRTLSRYVDERSGEVLPDSYGRCDRESNCGYHLGPYHQGASGVSYADEVFEAERENRRGVARPAPHYSNRPAALRPRPEQAVHTLPDEVFTRSLGHYERNVFARLLRQHVGLGVADELLTRFQIGTSAHYSGACVFWYIDERGRKRGGQIKLFGEDWHTVKYVDAEGRKRSRTNWVHAALIRRYKAQNQPVPQWLELYDQYAERSPCLFGLPQLQTAPPNQPVAIVEAPKTAILCTSYFPAFVWLAVGSLSNLTLNTDAGRARLAPLRGRTVMLFPDLSAKGTAFGRWAEVAGKLKEQGWCISVSDYLERRATPEQKRAGLDLADYLINQWKGYPPDWK